MTSIIIINTLILLSFFILFLKFSIKNKLFDIDDKTKRVSPYVLNVENNTDELKKCVLFGASKNLSNPNFGSDLGVSVKMAYDNISYGQLLYQSGYKPFETEYVRIHSSNPSQLTQILHLDCWDANGQELYYPINTSIFFSAMQFQSSIIDINHNIKIDFNTMLTINVLPKSNFTISLFPKPKKENYFKLKLNNLKRFIMTKKYFINNKIVNFKSKLKSLFNKNKLK